MIAASEIGGYEQIQSNEVLFTLIYFIVLAGRYIEMLK